MKICDDRGGGYGTWPLSLDVAILLSGLKGRPFPKAFFLFILFFSN